ncbi:MAG: hypothetical protein ACE37J_01540 [Pikeienuella sp.]|uniref:hypothetical protein n=1 Tax=Pikeienuella sp. TaxID=2831957 RepID=UPI0039196533
MKHFAFASALAAGLFAAASALAAPVAPPGGAIAGASGTFASERGVDGFDIMINGSFFAASNLASTSAPRNFIASAEIGLNGSTVFGGSAETGPVVIDDLLFAGLAIFGPTIDVTTFAPPLIEGVFDIKDVDLSLFGTSLTDLLPFAPLLPEVAFSVALTGFGGNAVEGTFGLTTFLSDALLGATGLGAPPASATFSGEFAIQPVPVPAALPLALTGAALLGGLGWRKRRKAARAA